MGFRLFSTTTKSFWRSSSSSWSSSSWSAEYSSLDSEEESDEPEASEIERTSSSSSICASVRVCERLLGNAEKVILFELMRFGGKRFWAAKMGSERAGGFYNLLSKQN